MWDKCSIRQWLNNSFFENAFTDEEKTFILEEEVIYKHAYKRRPALSTKDKVFLLSSTEIFGNRDFSTKDIIGQGTNYAREQVSETRKKEIVCEWWLCDHGWKKKTAGIVDKVGDCSMPEHDKFITYYFGIRPAMWIIFDN